MLKGELCGISWVDELAVLCVAVCSANCAFGWLCPKLPCSMFVYVCKLGCVVAVCCICELES